MQPARSIVAAVYDRRKKRAINETAALTERRYKPRTNTSIRSKPFSMSAMLVA